MAFGKIQERARGLLNKVDAIREEAQAVTSCARHSFVSGTSWHPVWVDTQGRFVDIANLKPGDELRAADGDGPVVAAVRRHSRVEPVYDLTIDGVHTYHIAVGGSSVLVHNCGRGGLSFTDAGREEVYEKKLKRMVVSTNVSTAGLRFTEGHR